MNVLKRLSSRFHLALGMASLVVTLLLAALFAGLLPDRDAALRSGRTALAEAVGVAATALVGGGVVAGVGAGAETDAGADNDARLQQVLDFVVSRNPELLSLALRQADGVLRLQSGAAGHEFTAAADGRSTETHVRVPLLHDGGVWGHAEMHFKPIEGTASFSLHRGSPALLVLVVGSASFVLFYLYLRRMLKHLDPARVIPGRVRTAFDTLAEGVLVLDPEGRVVLANQAFASIVGTAADKLVGRSAEALGWSQPPGAAPESTPWAALRSDGLARRNVLLYLHDSSGKRRSFMANGSPVPGANGKPAGMLVSLDDVTALEEKEIQLRLARDAAEQANRAKSDFLANMSHEIRTPMNAILGFTELLKRGWQQDPQHTAQNTAPNRAPNTARHLDTILSSGKHLLALINDILDLSKVEAGRLEIERVDCAVHEVVHEVVDIMRVRGDEKGVQLQLEFPQALPALMAADPARLRQIVTNLVGNALKFTAQGQVTVRVYLQNDADTPQLHIDVADTGIGIPADKLQDIFEPFVQASASTTRQYGGTGLGLAISRRFARALGGDIVATSVPGQGSCFHVSVQVGALPVGTPWLQPAALAQRVAQADTEASNQRWVFEPATVLVVDDGAENRELVRLVLESSGLTVEEAENGAIAVQRVAASEPALVLMDVQMPVMDGYTATRTLRERGHTVPVLALTANAMKGFEADIASAGFNGHLTKPVNIDLLLQTLARYLPARQAAPDELPAGASAVARDDPFEEHGADPSGLSVPKPADTLRQAQGEREKLDPFEREKLHPFERENLDPFGLSLSKPSDTLRQAQGERGQLDPFEREKLHPFERENLDPFGLSLSKPAAPPPALPPIHSRLAAHPRLARVVRTFARTLPVKLQLMQDALAARRFTELGELAHWLKGAGGTVGFDAFFEPARLFEQHARQQDLAELENDLRQLQSLATRLVVPTEIPAAKNASNLPVLDDALA